MEELTPKVAILVASTRSMSLAIQASLTNQSTLNQMSQSGLGRDWYYYRLFGLSSYYISKTAKTYR